MKHACRTHVALATASTCLALGLGMATATPAVAQDSAESVEMQRLYNPNGGEHFYTADAGEANELASLGWQHEGVGWVAPRSSSTPVHRLYNPNGGDHHYTTSADERNQLAALGWVYEGVGWYSSDGRTIAVLRQYNPNAASGSHNFTTSRSENDQLVERGWNAEGIGWYALAEGRPAVDGAIMGVSGVTPQRMAAWFRAKGGSYPTEVEARGGAGSIDDFTRILCEEAAAEGVRAEVVFCQAMLETGWLRYGGDVRPEQYNYAGIGATGGGARGASFGSVREGLRAQVQHLKAYASTDKLANTQVDPRFGYVTRGVAPTVYDLGGRWAVPGETYGRNIVALMTELANFRA